MPDIPSSIRAGGPTPSGQSLGDHLRQARLALGLTLREVEARTNRSVTNGYLSQIEKGSVRQPSPNVLYNLAEVYGLDYRDLLVRGGHHVPAEQGRGAGGASDGERLHGIPLRAIQELSASEREELTEYITFLRQRRERRGEGT
jgi:transcriptional regulator with XRE-family HTH domain